MKIIIGGFLIIFGVGWVVFDVVLYFVMKSMMSSFMDFPAGYILPFSIVGVVTGLIGLILLISGLRSRKKDKEKAEYIFNQGIPGKGRVTFVDKNYSMLVNEKPIYSIVEFVFTDHMGRDHTSRKDNVESDLVIRN